MAIFPHIDTEDIIQVNDKLRIDASKSIASKGESAITLVEVEPEAGSGFIDITGTSFRDWYLDWEYATDGTKTISLRITTDGLPTSETLDIECVTEVDDKLFASDYDLEVYENDIRKWVQPGRNTFKNIHRLAQTDILEWLYRNGYTARDGEKLTLDAILDTEEVREWSIFLALSFIFETLSNSVGDIFEQKARGYRSRMLTARRRSILRLDLNGDGVGSVFEGYNLITKDLVRR